MIVLLWDAFSLCIFFCSQYGGGNMAEKPLLMSSVLLALTPRSQRKWMCCPDCWELPCSVLEGCWWGLRGRHRLAFRRLPRKTYGHIAPHRQCLQGMNSTSYTIFSTVFSTIAPSTCPTRTEQQQIDKGDLWKFLFLFYEIYLSTYLSGKVGMPSLSQGR